MGGHPRRKLKPEVDWNVEEDLDEERTVEKGVWMM